MRPSAYVWPGFRLVVDPDAGTVVTHYADGRWSGGPVVDADVEHAARLGLERPLAHRLHHELAHHVVAVARARTPTLYSGGCEIIWRDAHRWPQPDAQAALDEWSLTAFQSYAAGAPMRDPGEWGALIDLERAGVDVPALARRFRWLAEAAHWGGTILLEGDA